MKLKYDYMDKEVIIDAVKSDCCDGYNMIEYIVESNDEPQIVAGPYPTKRDALMAGVEYVLSITGE